MTRLLITGASGQLGSYLLHHLAALGRSAVAWSGSTTGERAGFPLSSVDLTDEAGLTAAFRSARPDAVLHAAALARADDCHRDPARARRVNAWASARLADLCAAAGARLVLVSTDLVFDGEKGGYREDDPALPLSVYGHSKREAEVAVLAHPGHAAARVSLLYGPSLAGRPSFFDQQVAAFREGRPVTQFHDEWRTPLDLRTAAAALVRLADSREEGIFHVGGPERMSRLEMGRRLAKALGLDPAAVRAVSRLDVPAGEPRPRDTSLDSSRWRRTFPDVPWPVIESALA